MRILAAVLALALSTSGAQAQTANVERIEVYSHGTYSVEIEGMTSVPGAPAGTVAAATPVRQIASTRNVEARIGVEFGFEYVVLGGPQGAEVTVEIMHHFPPPGLADPSASRPLLESHYQRTKTIGAKTYVGFGFEHEWELVPGEWRIEIWNAGKRLADEHFNVTR